MVQVIFNPFVISRRTIIFRNQSIHFMTEYPSATNYPSANQNDVSIFNDPYQKEVLEDNYLYGKKKTRYTLFSIGIVFLITSIIGYLSIGLPLVDNIVYILLLPLIFVGLGLFSNLQPLIAAIGGIAVVAGLTIFNYIQLGPMSIIAGWLYKVIILYFLIRCFQHAKDAERAKKELEVLE
jgi:uncharacterized membrane protein